MARSGNIAHFLELELDARTGELRVAGSEPVRLADQPLQILLALLERPGELVSREELRERLWPSDTVVEFEHSISAAMNRLRRLIGDSPENPRLIETLARRGYRLKVAVDWGDVAALKSPPKSTAAEKLGASVLGSRAPQYAWGHVLYLAGAVAVAIAIAAITVMLFQSSGMFSAASKPIWKQRQLTVNSSEDPVSGAAISPDGKYLASLLSGETSAARAQAS